MVKHNILEIPFSDNFFDYVVSLDVLGHVEKPDKDRLLKEIKRVLKPGGKTLHGIEEGNVDYSNMTDSLIDYIRIDGHVGLQTIDQIKELFSQYFEGVEAEFAFGPCPNYYDLVKYKDPALPLEFYNYLETFSEREIQVFSMAMGLVREGLSRDGLLKGGGFVFLKAENSKIS